MWIAENSDTTLAMIKNINDRRKGKNVNTSIYSSTPKSYIQFLFLKKIEVVVHVNRISILQEF